jgi:hypothetical protein
MFLFKNIETEKGFVERNHGDNPQNNKRFPSPGEDHQQLLRLENLQGYRK